MRHNTRTWTQSRTLSASARRTDPALRSCLASARAHCVWRKISVPNYKLDSTKSYLYNSAAIPMISAVHKSGRPNAFVSMIERAWDKVFTDASNGSDGIAKACITSEGECLDRIEVTRSFDKSSWKCPLDASVNSPENRRGSAWMDMCEPKSGEDTQQTRASFGERAALTGTV